MSGQKAEESNKEEGKRKSEKKGKEKKEEKKLGEIFEAALRCVYLYLEHLKGEKAVPA